eukprot:scaffold5167_cov66-Phaeocystis_antarctica.AAC.1
MALSKLSADEHGIILSQLCNALEPRLTVYFSSASSGLRVLLTPALLQQLKADHEVAAALCRKMGMSCKELREAKKVSDKGLSVADLATLGSLGSVLPALEVLLFGEYEEGPYVQRLVEGLVAGALPAVTALVAYHTDVCDAGASALAAALGRGALPRLETLVLGAVGIGDAGLVALAPALQRLPALQQLELDENEFGDEGLAALVAPPPPAGALPRPTGVLAKLKNLRLESSQVTDAGCATLIAALGNGALPSLVELKLGMTPISDASCAALAAALDSGALPALKKLGLGGTDASVAAREAVLAALARSTGNPNVTLTMQVGLVEN